MRGHAVDDAVGAHLRGVVDVNGDPGLHARLHEQHLDVEVLADHRGNGRIEGRHDRRHDGSVEAVVQLVADELPRQDAVLVEGPLTGRGEAPGVYELIAAIDPEDDVRVADVDDEEIRHEGRVPRGESFVPGFAPEGAIEIQTEGWKAERLKG